MDNEINGALPLEAEPAKPLKKAKKRHNILRVVIFSLIALFFVDIIGRYISIFAVNSLLFWRTVDFYTEPEDSLDAVIIGSSSTYSFWNAPLAWEQYGITVFPFSTAQQSFSSARFVIEECMKTQPDSLYIINLNMALVEDITPARIHFLSDVMPPSVNRIKTIRYLCQTGGYDTIGQQLEYYYPIFAMHSRWKRTTSPFEPYSGKDCKGASVDPMFINTTNDVSGDLYFTDVRGYIPDSVLHEMELLTEFLEEKDVEAAFVLSPASFTGEVLANFNSICDWFREKGYRVYNGLDDFKETGLDPHYDYFDFSHTNFQGAQKFTHWLGGRLQEDFGLTDKRGDPSLVSWDEAVDIYRRIVTIRTLS